MIGGIGGSKSLAQLFKQIIVFFGEKMENSWKRDVCLLLIDVQEDFYSVVKDSFPDFETNITNLLSLCRDNGIHVIHIRAEYNSNVSEWLDYWRILNERSRKGVVSDIFPDTPTSFAKEIEGEEVIVKNTFDGFYNTNLHNLLQEKGIKHILFAGMVTSCCVLFTMTGAFFRGYKTTMITDCCADRTQEKQDSTINIYGAYMFSKTKYSELLAYCDDFHKRCLNN